MEFMKNKVKNLLEAARKAKLASVITILLVFTVILSSVVTYIAITNPDVFGFGSATNVKSTLLRVHFGLLLLLAVIVCRRLVHLYFSHKRGRSGSRLLMKLVAMSSLIAIIPAIVVALSSSYYLNLSMKLWFDQRVSRAVVESVAVADAYLREHKEIVRADATTMANEMNGPNFVFGISQPELVGYLNEQAGKRILAEAIVFRKDNFGYQIIAAYNPSFQLNSRLTRDAVQIADGGHIALLSDDDTDKATALIKLNNYDERYLLISRFVDSKVLMHTAQAKGAADEYLKLKKQIGSFQVESTIYFVIISIYLLLGAIWMAFRFANNLVVPISNLVSATDRVKKGEFTVRVKEGPENDEIGILSRSFNQMAEELDNQKHDLMRANRDSEERAAFTETVLLGVSSGVMAIDVDRKIITINRIAMDLLAVNKSAIGKRLNDVAEEFEGLLKESIDKKNSDQQSQVSIRRKQKRMNLMVRVTPQTNRRTVEGYIFTFDDITELLSAQRHAAWSDVARRIAHEIKNPLTPINLSAQRIAKKYKNLVPDDERENFEGYTDTITRHTADIAKIITEFSDFAKMPSPKFSRCDISELLKSAVFSARVAHSNVTIELDMPDKMETVADPSQITQVLTNTMKNAAESISDKDIKDGKIMVIAQLGKNIEIYIDDNGGGFPDELIDRLTEPYVTTRSKGTGLGLAIVKKIMEDHNGKLELSNIKNGARVKLVLPIV